MAIAGYLWCHSEVALVDAVVAALSPLLTPTRDDGNWALQLVSPIGRDYMKVSIWVLPAWLLISLGLTGIVPVPWLERLPGLAARHSTLLCAFWPSV
jgi:hypothetical protein